MRFFSVNKGLPDRFIMVGIEGPNISASSRPTSWEGKCRLKARARFTLAKRILVRTSWYDTLYYCILNEPATVDLPTPPLPEATRMTFFTPSIGFLTGKPFFIIWACRSFKFVP